MTVAQRDFWELANHKWRQNKFVCVGLDFGTQLPIPLYSVLQEQGLGAAFMYFARAIVAVTGDVVGAYKINSAFYEAHGTEGISALRRIIRSIHEWYPTIPVILDAKRGDIAFTNERYAQYAFGFLGADAITVHPYMGQESLAPFLGRSNKGVFVLCRTTGDGADEFQGAVNDDNPLYVRVAARVAEHWNKNQNCGLVVGATNPHAIRRVREVAPDIPLLIPGVGAQGGDVLDAVSAAHSATENAFFVSASRSIVFASFMDDFAGRARQRTLALHEQIQARG